mmetsp:Transcript_89707/g.233968  ORF Transcript_89707/g.233968 Transcript_89707/m.233968 type:complete len:477 (+) Transcript_89707:74-1504(+)
MSLPLRLHLPALKHLLDRCGGLRFGRRPLADPPCQHHLVLPRGMLADGLGPLLHEDLDVFLLLRCVPDGDRPPGVGVVRHVEHHAVATEHGTMPLDVRAREVVVLLQSELGVEAHLGLGLGDEEVSQDEVMGGHRCVREAPRDVPRRQHAAQLRARLACAHARKQEASGRDRRDHEPPSASAQPVGFVLVLGRVYVVQGAVIHPPADVIRHLAARLPKLFGLSQGLVPRPTKAAAVGDRVEAQAAIVLETLGVHIPAGLDASRLERFLDDHATLDALGLVGAPGAHHAEMDVLRIGEGGALLVTEAPEEGDLVLRPQADHRHPVHGVGEELVEGWGHAVLRRELFAQVRFDGHPVVKLVYPVRGNEHLKASARVARSTNLHSMQPTGRKPERSLEGALKAACGPLDFLGLRAQSRLLGRECPLHFCGHLVLLRPRDEPIAGTLRPHRAPGGGRPSRRGPTPRGGRQRMLWAPRLNA